MAGDWIKFECTTPDKPEVIAMAMVLGIDQDAVTGKLVRVWIWADQNSVDGNAIGVTGAFLDRHTACPGFAEAMRKVGWLTGQDGSVTFPGFSRHNGESAKTRAQSNRRVASHRQKRQCNGNSVTQLAAPALPKPLPEKRREEVQERESTAPAVAGGIDPGNPGPLDRATTAPSDEIGTLAEVIALAYPRQDDPIGCMSIIADNLLAGQDAEQMRLAVQRCANFIRKAPGGSGNRYVPSARAFFAECQWRSPEAFESRWQADGHESAQPARKPVKLTTAPKNGF